MTTAATGRAAPEAATGGHAPAAWEHHTTGEGLRLGLLVAAVTWTWTAAYDFATGQPFHTFAMLGGATTFTTIHVALCLAYGLAIVGALHAAMKTPTVVFAMIFCTILFQAAFAMLTAFVANLGVGDHAWGSVFAGNVLAVVLTWAVIARRHPLGAMFHAAEEELQG